MRGERGEGDARTYPAIGIKHGFAQPIEGKAPAALPADVLRNPALFAIDDFLEPRHAMGDGVIAIDESYNVALYNGAALNILDVNSTMVGKPVNEVLKLQDKNNQPVDIKKVIQDTKVSTASRDWRLQYPDGETISLYISIAPVRLGYGKDGEYICFDVHPFRTTKPEHWMNHLVNSRRTFLLLVEKARA